MDRPRTRVLVVDDEDQFRSLVTELLADRGFDAHAAPDAKTALNLAVTKALVGKNEVRDAVRIWLYDDANLAALVAEGLITYDKSGKDQKIALA